MTTLNRLGNPAGLFALGVPVSGLYETDTQLFIACGERAVRSIATPEYLRVCLGARSIAASASRRVLLYPDGTLCIDRGYRFNALDVLGSEAIRTAYLVRTALYDVARGQCDLHCFVRTCFFRQDVDQLFADLVRDSDRGAVGRLGRLARRALGTALYALARNFGEDAFWRK